MLLRNAGSTPGRIETANVINMGKSVFLLPRANDDAVRIQMRKVREELGPGLKLEGPFSDKAGAVTGIADRMRSIVSGTEHRMRAAMINLMPQDCVHGNFPHSKLDIPFIMSTGPHRGWVDYPESAGAVASIGTVEFGNGEARRVDIIELTMLMISVLRMLRIECYYALSTCSEPKLRDDGLSLAGFTMPVIIIPNGPSFGLASAIPEQIKLFSVLPPDSFEVLDEDALLCLIKLQNAYKHAEALMKDIAAHEPRPEGELRSIRIGHMVSEGRSLWAMPDAIHANGDPVSARVKFEKGIVRIMTSIPQHTWIAASVMFPEEIREIMHKSAGGRLAKPAELLDAISRQPSTPAFMRYIKLTRVMKEHLHAKSECMSGMTGN